MTFSWFQSIVNFFLNYFLCFRSLLSAGWAHVESEILQKNVLSTITGLKLSATEHIMKEKELRRLPKKEKAH